MAVRRIALPGAIGQIVLATAVTAGCFHLFGWAMGPSLIMGLCSRWPVRSCCSRRWKSAMAWQHQMAASRWGWLIVEDLAMVLALVLVPAFAGVLGGHVSEDGGHGATGGNIS